MTRNSNQDPFSADLLIRYDILKKSMAVAYILLIFLGAFGAHRFYIGRTVSAVIMLVLTLTIVGYLITALWFLIDLFLTYGMVKEHNLQLLERLSGTHTPPPVPENSPTKAKWRRFGHN